jgi:hypothetical protein
VEDTPEAKGSTHSRGKETPPGTAGPIPAYSPAKRHELLMGLAGLSVLPILTFNWFLFGGGLKTLCWMEADASFAAGVVAGLVVCVIGLIVASGRAFFRGVAVGGWVTLLEVAAFVQWRNGSWLLASSSSGGNAGAAAGFQVIAATFAFLICGIVGAVGAFILYLLVVPIEFRWRERRTKTVQSINREGEGPPRA